MVQKNATFRRNLSLGLGLSLFLLILTSLASYISIRNLIKSTDLLRKNNLTLETLNSVESHLKDAETAQRGFIITGDNRFINPYHRAKEKTIESLNDLKRKTAASENQRLLISTLERDLNERLDVLDENLETRRKGREVTADKMLAGKEFMDGTRRVIQNMKMEEQKLLDARTVSLNAWANITPAIIVITALLALGITIIFFRKVLSDFKEKEKLQEELEQKSNEIDDRINVIEKVAAEVSEGNYNIRIDEDSQDNLGNLASSLNQMTESLAASFNLLAEKEWFQSGVASLSEEMVGEKTLTGLADSIVENLAEYTGSNSALLYVLQEDDRLHLVGTYAPDLEHPRQILQRKEGIPGQCLQSNKPILLEDVPEEEAGIAYGAGKIKPRNVFCVPVSENNIPFAVMEFASLRAYTTQEKDFLSYVAENVGIALTAAENRRKMRELLEETQAQSEELQSQQSELENINAELEAQAQKLQASEEELQVQQEELLESNQQLEERTSMLQEKNQLVEERNREIEKKSKELELSSKYKSEFLANMSHELRTPLNSILLLSKLMSESDNLDDEYIEYAEVIQSSGQGLLSLIDEILDLSKIESGKMELEIEDMPVSELLQELYATFQPIANNKNLTLNIENPESQKLHLFTDRLRLGQILKNLLSNAIKFTQSGEVKLDVREDMETKTVSFHVKDTGIGIPADKQELIFEAFKQADGSTRRKFGGTGLGLSISRELTRLLKGQLTLKSEEGKGTEFTLTIPVDIRQEVIQSAPQTRTPEVRQEEPKPQPAGEQTKQKRYLADFIPGAIPDDRDDIQEGDKIILIIEDDTAFAKLLLDYAREKEYKGIVAVRGDEGVEMAQKFKPNAILLDIQLPVIDGWQVMESLKDDPGTRAIPVHMMSSLKMKHESLLKGAVDFIDKPFALERMKDIFQKLEKALSKHPKKVLIVEENNQHAKALSYFLNANNIGTMISNNLPETVAAFQGEDIDCVILDMGMPDALAYDALEKVKENKGLENLPIIVFTGKDLSVGEENRIKKYADSIVVKTAHSYQRILDEAGLFLHLVEENNKSGAALKTENLDELSNVLKNKTVLIADDDVRNIFSLTKTLEMHQMNVLTAIDGKEALRILNDHKNVDVVLMDMMMPEMDGYETIRLIRQQQKFKRLPILAVTAKAMRGDRDKCIQAGASDYISKPVDVDQLVSLLRVWLYDKIA